MGSSTELTGVVDIARTVQVEIDTDVCETARRAAQLDSVDMSTLVEICRADIPRTVQPAAISIPNAAFDLDVYERGAIRMRTMPTTSLGRDSSVERSQLRQRSGLSTPKSIFEDLVRMAGSNLFPR